MVSLDVNGAFNAAPNRSYVNIFQIIHHEIFILSVNIAHTCSKTDIH